MQRSKIECQKCKDIPERESQGCYTCKGYGYLVEFVKEACPICKQSAWFRPGEITKFEGMTYYSFDGLCMIAHLAKPDNCIECELTKDTLEVPLVDLQRK